MTVMKNIKYFGISLLMTFAFVSCDDYLDINTNPDSPTNFSVSVEHRLPALEYVLLHCYGGSGHLSSLIGQQIMTSFDTYGNRNNRFNILARWTPNGNGAESYRPYTPIYQEFYTNAGTNLQDLYDKAEKENAYHYMATVKFFRAIGFMLMTDLYGETIHTQAFNGTINGQFDDGKTIFEGALRELDEAIALFKQTQPAGATPLAKGDWWNDGDAGKWLKMCYGFKARWLNNLSKKSSLYKPDDILAAIENAPKSNLESTIVKHEDAGTGIEFPNIGDPNMTSIAYSWLTYWGDSKSFFVTKWYADLLTDFDGKGIVDPRAWKLIPAVQNTLTSAWELSDGVDTRTNVRNDGSYDKSTINAGNGWTLTSTDGNHYVALTSPGIVTTTTKEKDADGTHYINSGTFYTRPDAPTTLMTYSEMCFIKAEILFNKGDKPGAFTAYKDGIQAHFDLLNTKLAEYGTTDNISKQIIPQTDIDTYLNSAAVGTSGDLTLGKIMQQKYIALGFSHQNWNDQRRYDYKSDVYRGWTPPYEHTNAVSKDPAFPNSGDMFRRFQQCYIEINNNNISVEKSHPHALLQDIFSFPVWWDIAE
ncbi:hypothetical protein AGMMS49965_04530 [Bacteroidia bacterium]|nr:hypothetical protein AGMMS49965_04530 [Bacteroidia bacterium]